MRQAVVVAPPRFVLPDQGSVFAAAEPIGPLCAALARGGRRLLLVQSTTELTSDFDHAIAHVSPDDDLVVYLAAETTTGSPQVTLRTGADTHLAVQLSSLSDAILARGPSGVLFVIEACHDGDGDDPMVSAEHVDSILRALDVRARGYGALVGVRPESHPTHLPWPFTRHVLAALDDPASRDEHGAAQLPLVHELLRARGALASDVQSFALVRGRGDFSIIESPVVSDVAPRLQSAPTLERTPSDSGLESSGDPAVPPAPPVDASLRPTVDASIESAIEPLASAHAPPVDAAVESTPPSSVDVLVESAPAAPSAAVVPEPRPTQPSLPAIEPLLDLADGARERGALPEALAGYKAALMVVAPGDPRLRASIYARIGHLKRAQGKPREAELNFEKALSADPTHAAALDALVELATEANEVRRAIEWRRKRLESEAAPDERVAQLLSIAEAYTDQLQDMPAAAAAIDEASAVDHKGRSSLERLRALHEKTHRWPPLVEVLAELADMVEEPKDRSALRFAAADVALGRLRDEERGLALLDRAIEDDPTNDRALQALVSVRTARGDWQELDAVYAGLVDRLVGVGDRERAWDVGRKLGVLRRDKLCDVTGAIQAFASAVRCKTDDVDSRAMLADLHLAVGDEPRAVAEFEHIARLAPTRSSTYARLFGLHRRAGRTDRAWLVGAALEELGTADMDQQLVVDQFRLDGTIRPSRSLDDDAWDQLLRAPGADPVVADVLRCIAPTAVAIRVDELRQARQLLAIDPARRQSAASTVTAVRSFQWAAQVLGVTAPDLYVMDNVPGGIAAVQAAAPTTALGPDVLRGLTTKELAFLAARHLTYFRPEHYPLIFYPTVNDLSVLFLGAVKIAMPELPVPAALDEAVTRTRKVLARQATVDERRRLAAAVEQLNARDGRVDLAAWIRGVELTAQRAGLLMCGDLSVATSRLRTEAASRTIADLTYDQKRADLLAFCASERLARARELLGVDARKSVSGPPPGELQAS